MYHAESLNTGFRIPTVGAAFTDESLRTRISLRLRVVPFLRGGGFRGGFTPPCKVPYCTVLVRVLTSCLILGTGTVRRENNPSCRFADLACSAITTRYSSDYSTVRYRRSKPSQRGGRSSWYE